MSARRRCPHALRLAGAAALALGLLAVVPAQATTTVTTVTLVMTDAQGNVVMKKDVNGNVIARYDYRPYGAQQDGPVNAGPGYTGHVNDPDTGLVYMQQRYYDADVGRFASVDPIGPTPGNIYNVNRYAYVNNSPFGGVDPTGEYPDDLDGNPIGGNTWRSNCMHMPMSCIERNPFALDTKVKSSPVTHAIDPSVPENGYSTATAAGKAAIQSVANDAKSEYAGITLTRGGRFWYTAPATIHERGKVILTFTKPDDGYKFANVWYHTHPFGGLRSLVFSGADVRTTINLSKALKLKMIGLVGMHQDGSIRIFDPSSMPIGIRSDRYHVHGKQRQEAAEGEILCENCFP